MTPLQIVPTTPSHLDRILEIERSSFSYPASLNRLRALMNQNNVRFLTALDRNNVAMGYAILLQESRKGHLISLAVDPSNRRQGISRSLLEEVMNLLREDRLIGGYLEVREKNRAAYNLYIKSGWHVHRKKTTFYENGDTALIMAHRNLELDEGSLLSAKSACRQYKRSQRRNVGIRLRTGKNETIGRRLKAHAAFQYASSILFYSPMIEEASAEEAVYWALSQGKTISYPYVDREHEILVPCRVSNPSEMSNGPWEIAQPHPSRNPSLSPESLDLIIVPGIAFDYAGGRVGHGKGYYDRLLSTCPGIPTIALAYEEQMEELVPMGPRDVPVASILTDQAQYGGSIAPTDSANFQ